MTLEQTRAGGYNPDQPRDDHGRFGSTGGGSSSTPKPTGGRGRGGGAKIKDDSTLQGRLGNCYRLNAQYVLDKRDGTKLVHGSIQGMGNPRIDHAWALRPDGTVHDAVLDIDLPKSVYASLFHTQEDHTYTKEQVFDSTVKTDHWGPWEDGATTVKELQGMTPDELNSHMSDVLDRINTGMSLNMDTLHMFDMVNGIEGKYTQEREVQQMKIADEVLNRPGIESNKEMLIMAGLPGAGKTTFLNQSALLLGIDTSKYVDVNPDNVKEMMIKDGMVPDYSSLKITTNEGATLYHDESAHIAAMIATAAGQRGMNVLVDSTMKNEAQFNRYMKQINPDSDYKTTMILIDTPKEISIERATNRYVNGDRMIPLDNIRNIKDGPHGETGSRDTFNKVSTVVDHAILVDADKNIVFDKVNHPEVKAAGYNPDQPRDDHGRFGGGDSGNSGGGTNTFSKAVAQVSNLRDKDGGFTINPVTGRSPMGTGDGKGNGPYAVAIHKPGSTLVTQINTKLAWSANKPALTDSLRSFVKQNKELLSQSGMHIGGWHNPEDDSVHFDIVQVFPKDSLDEAKMAGTTRNQIAITDLSTFKSISTGGTGE